MKPHGPPSVAPPSVSGPVPPVVHPNEIGRSLYQRAADKFVGCPRNTSNVMFSPSPPEASSTRMYGGSSLSVIVTVADTAS